MSVLGFKSFCERKNSIDPKNNQHPAKKGKMFVEKVIAPIIFPE